MKDKELKRIYIEYFQEKMKQSEKYKTLFGKAVDELKDYLESKSEEEKKRVERIIDNFLGAEDQMLEDTFVNAVKYAYKVFKEIVI